MKYPLTYYKILDSATTKFRAKGYAAVSISDILSGTGATRSSLYHFFPGGKDELAEAVLKNIQRKSTANFEKYFKGEKDPVVEICEYLEAKVREIDESNEQLSASMLLLEIAEVGPRLCEMSMEVNNALNRHFYQQVAKCGLSEEVTCQISAMILSMCLGAISHCHARRDSTLLKNTIPQIPLLFTANGYNVPPELLSTKQF